MAPVRAPRVKRIIVAALAALALAGCGATSSTTPASGRSAGPAGAASVGSSRSHECVFSSVFGPTVTDCASADATVASNMYSSGDCSTSINKLTINWGDGSKDQAITMTGPAAAHTPKLEADHTYSRHGVYSITISGYISSGPCTFTPPTITYTFTYTSAAVAGQVGCTRQDPSVCLLASNAVAGLDVGDDDSDAPPGETMENPDVNPDGFAAAEFADRQGNIIIANEDADLASPLGSATSYQNSSFLALATIYEGAHPAALNSAVQYAQQVAAANPNARIYVTGFGLGGVEAEAQALALGSRVTGGVTFGAPGLPGHQVNGSESTVTNFVDYGDPVGNWASDPQSELPELVPEGLDHFGGVDLIGDPANAALPRLAANLHGLLSDNIIEKIIPDLPVNALIQTAVLKLSGAAEAAEKANAVADTYDTVLKVASYSYLAYSALTCHSLAQYAKDLGVSLTPTVAPATELADFHEFDPNASSATLEAADSTTVNADGAVNAPGYDLTANTAADKLDTQTFTDQSNSQYDVTYDPAEQISTLAVNDPSGTSYEISNDDAGQQAWSSRVYYYSGPNETGTLTGVLYDWHSGGSQLQLFSGLPQGVSKETLDYSQPDATGTLLSKTSS